MFSIKNNWKWLTKIRYRIEECHVGAAHRLVWDLREEGHQGDKHRIGEQWVKKVDNQTDYVEEKRKLVLIIFEIRRQPDPSSG